MKQPNFLHIDTNSQKIKDVQKFFGRSGSKYGCSQSGPWTLKWTLYQE